MAIAHDPIAEINDMIEASVEQNTNFTTCPVCLSGVDPDSLHKEPYIALLPGSGVEIGMIRRVHHLPLPDGGWKTCVTFDYE